MRNYTITKRRAFMYSNTVVYTEHMLLLQQPTISPLIIMVVVVAALFSLCVLLLLLLAIIRKRRRFWEEEDDESSSREERQRRVAAAASSRQRQQQQQQQHKKKKKKKLATMSSSSSSSSSTSRIKPTKANELMAQQTKQVVEKEQQQQEEEDAPKIRKATTGDKVAWNEERASQEQFGFSIYGHTANEFGCCCYTATKSSSLSSSTTTNNKTVPTGFHAIQNVSEISEKVDALAARDLLLRIAHEFEPVVRARGWIVQNLVELCTCKDDVHSKPLHVAGYCVSLGNARTAVSIHLRLRPSCQAHHFFPYQHLVQTMAHELAHIVIAPHNDAFFQLMAEIEQEYAQSVVVHSNSGGVGGSDGIFALTSGRRLGTANNNNGSISQFAPILGSKELKASVANAAIKRLEAFQQRNHANEKEQEQKEQQHQDKKTV